MLFKNTVCTDADTSRANLAAVSANFPVVKRKVGFVS